MRVLFLFLTLSGICCFPFGMTAQVDVLDETFGPNGDGTVTQYFIDNAFGRQVAIQSGDKILVSIEVQDFFLNNHKIMRYTANGIIDSTFGTNGIVDVDFFDDNEFISTMEVLPDDRILIAGYGFTDGDSDFFAARFLADGAVDPTFGTNGLARFDLDEKQQTLGAMGIDPNGDLLLVGWHLETVETDALIVKLTADGQLDTSFDDDGFRLINYGINDQLQGIYMEDDGSFWTVGQSLETTHFDVLVTKHLASGQPDLALDGDGVLRLDLDQGNDIGSKIERLGSGNYLIGGTFTEFGAQSGGLVQIQPNGGLESSFGTAGWRVLDDSGPNFFSDFLLLEADSILTLGFQSNLDFDIQLYKMDQVGFLDMEFGSFGVILTDLEVDETAAAFAFQSSGRLILVGSIDPPGLFDISMLMLAYDVVLPVSTNNPVLSDVLKVTVLGNPIQQNQLRLAIELERTSAIQLRLVNAVGKVVQPLYDGHLPEGENTLEFELLNHLPKGVYWLEVQTDFGKKALPIHR